MYKMQKQIDHEDYALQVKQIEYDNKCQEMQALQQNLAKQDSEIEMNRKNIENCQKRISE